MVADYPNGFPMEEIMSDDCNEDVKYLEDCFVALSQDIKGEIIYASRDPLYFHTEFLVF